VFAISIYGDPLLRKTAEPISRFDDELKCFADEMIVTMRGHDGVGLAATQIGKSVQLAVIDTSGGERAPLILINPEITRSSEEQSEEEEGCLSIPTIRFPVKRFSRISVRSKDIEGKNYVIDGAEGLLARVLQHEIDHLNGIFFIDHVSPLQRRLVSGKLKKLAKSGGNKK
jgi:peptide deformylase